MSDALRALATEGVLSYLEAAEAAELNPHLCADIRIAWITVLFASRGYKQPHVAATYAVLGLHPDKVWLAIVDRRKKMLGQWYEEFWGESSPPKKPVQSVRVVAPGERAA